MTLNETGSQLQPIPSSIQRRPTRREGVWRTTIRRLDAMARWNDSGSRRVMWDRFAELDTLFWGQEGFRMLWKGQKHLLPLREGV
ncbi:uncharacterized protein LACBIDRAFT_313196 [Laccaria bicolor S238N-H82]|uniref:Predicted protein n=1 Tax=Laccaria bicolor (strain S238N-H82 / ATCC MYA-4686) TaxID=486041 RepID=B0DXS1_LACBS|nr:uncharacterized protein LACBIDRAFT_313196 [Laccaria bicolor S238N-H82]EDR00733.1 predicted protein [Laccaria bicolor S238N-H82]|eukprot:XP_001888742.1 predicted protein [Laccaria bicolor S238N-H82]